MIAAEVVTPSCLRRTINSSLLRHVLQRSHEVQCSGRSMSTSIDTFLRQNRDDDGHATAMSVDDGVQQRNRSRYPFSNLRPCYYSSATNLSNKRSFERRSTLKSPSSSTMTFSTLALSNNNHDYDHDWNDTNESSSMPTSKTTPNTTPTMLGNDVLARIIQDLKDADVNHDGRVCYEELKLMLSKYSNIFTPDDIDYISNLFFVGKSGQSVRHTTFVRSLQYIASTATQSSTSPSTTATEANDEEKDTNRNDTDATFNGTKDDHHRDHHDRHYHPFLVRKNPIQLEQLVDTRCWITPGENKHTDPMFAYYDTQSEFESQLLRYIQEVIQLSEDPTTGRLAVKINR